MADTLHTLITRIQYDTSWGIWADVPFRPDAPARYGQCQFEQGGLLDDKVYFAHGVRCGDFIASYTDNDPEFVDEAADMLIDEIELERQTERNGENA